MKSQAPKTAMFFEKARSVLSPSLPVQLLNPEVIVAPSAQISPKAMMKVPLFTGILVSKC